MLRMMCYSVMTQAYLLKEIPSFPNRSRTYDLPITSSDALQGCQLSRIIRETPDFEPYLPVSRLMSGISRIIAEVAIYCRLDFPTIKSQIFCVVVVFFFKRHIIVNEYDVNVAYVVTSSITLLTPYHILNI